MGRGKLSKSTRKATRKAESGRSSALKPENGKKATRKELVEHRKAQQEYMESNRALVSKQVAMTGLHKGLQHTLLTHSTIQEVMSDYQRRDKTARKVTIKELYQYRMKKLKETEQQAPVQECK
tara:strand:+ start:1945 stop:2313 length:369 start_codon:yes stop_codon:yes gene_type:complete